MTADPARPFRRWQFITEAARRRALTSLRFASAQLPRVANGLALDNQFWRRFGEVLELEKRFQINGHPRKLRTLAFLNKTNSATYQDLVDHPATDPLRLRADRLKDGGALTGEQELLADLSAFFRLSINDGQTQTWSFKRYPSGGNCGNPLWPVDDESGI